jgi:5-methylcytosine-specific restriction endonuclease McrA
MPMNRGLYPANWDEISRRIRERDGQKCKECGVKNGAVGCRDQDGNFYTEEEIDRDGIAPGAILGKVIKIVLTVAHLNNTPMDCRDENLKSLCQRCHLKLDAPLHQANSAKTRHLKKVAAGQIELFV